jgi:hypothetical protein
LFVRWRAAVTEAEWLACENPNHALYLLRAVGSRSRRKDRLAAAAGLRQFWADLSPQQRQAVTAGERYADGEIRFPELRAAAVRVSSGAGGTLPGAVARVTHREAADALWNTTVLFLSVVVGGPVYTNPPFPEARAYAQRGRPMMVILRCIFGNPFHPATLDPAWLTPILTDLATVAYNERAMPSGELDTARLAVLADALEEVGCTNADILNHLRSLGPHVRGCWAVDLLTGRS